MGCASTSARGRSVGSSLHSEWGLCSHRSGVMQLFLWDLLFFAFLIWQFGRPACQRMRLSLGSCAKWCATEPGKNQQEAEVKRINFLQKTTCAQRMKGRCKRRLLQFQLFLSITVSSQNSSEIIIPNGATAFPVFFSKTRW